MKHEEVAREIARVVVARYATATEKPKVQLTVDKRTADLARRFFELKD